MDCGPCDALPDPMPSSAHLHAVLALLHRRLASGHKQLLSASQGCLRPTCSGPHQTLPVCCLATSMPCLAPELHTVCCDSLLCRERAPRHEQLLSDSQGYLQHIRARHRSATAARRDREARRRKAVADQLGLQQVGSTAWPWHRTACWPASSGLQRAAVVVAVLSTPRTLHTRYTSTCKVGSVAHKALTLC